MSPIVCGGSAHSCSTLLNNYCQTRVSSTKKTMKNRKVVINFAYFTFPSQKWNSFCKLGFRNKIKLFHFIVCHRRKKGFCELRIFIMLCCFVAPLKSDTQHTLNMMITRHSRTAFQSDAVSKNFHSQHCINIYFVQSRKLCLTKRDRGNCALSNPKHLQWISVQVNFQVEITL